MIALSMVSQAVLFLPIELLLLQDMWIFFCAFSGKAADADRAVSAITQTLTQLGFVVHEQSRASAAADFVGLRFEKQSVRAKPGRVWRLCMRIEALLRREVCSGDLLEVILGYVTWVGLLFRPSLAMLDSVYAFCRAAVGRPTRLRGSVRRELPHFVDLLPLIRSDLRPRWYTTVIASDSSMSGVGVCCRCLPLGLVRQHGRQSEKWRFR